MAVLEIDGVSKTYKRKGGTITAAEDVSFSVDAGEIVGLIGRNGAGKTTVLKIATGLAEPDSGTVRIDGHDIRTERTAALEKTGCVVENPDLYGNWSAMRNLLYLASLGGGRAFGKGAEFRENVRRRSEELLTEAELFDRRLDPVKKYSFGMKQRLGIAQALLCDPDLVILDEPTNGLDPEGIIRIRDTLVRLGKEEGKAVLVSSHLLTEVQKICDRFVIMDNGRVEGIHDRGDIERSGDPSILLETEDPAKAAAAITELFGAEAETLSDGKLSFVSGRSVRDTLRILMDADVPISGISERELSLEEFFMRVTDGGERP